MSTAEKHTTGPPSIDGPPPKTPHQSLRVRIYFQILVLAAILTGAVQQLASAHIPRGTSWPRRVLTECGFAPYLAIWLFLSTIAFLSFRYFLHLRLEQQHLDLDLIPAGQGQLERGERDAILQRCIELMASSRLLREILLVIGMRNDNVRIRQVNDTLARHRRTRRERARSAYLVPLGSAIGIAIVGNMGLLLDEAVRTDIALLAFPLSIVALLAVMLLRKAEIEVLARVEDYVLLRLLPRLGFDDTEGPTAGGRVPNPRVQSDAATK